MTMTLPYKNTNRTILLIILWGMMFFSFYQRKTNPIGKLQKEVEYILQRNIDASPPGYPDDTCFHATDILIFSIGKKGGIDSIQFSDSASPWLKKELMRLKNKNLFDSKKINTLLKNERLKKCKIIFPFIMETYAFPCGGMQGDRLFKAHSFKLNGENIAGNIFFGDPIFIKLSTRILSYEN